MPGLIRSNSGEVSQRRPMAGFTVRTGAHPFFEVAVAAHPELFRPEARAKRTPANFWSSRAQGPLPSERGEAVYMLPQDVLARFAGQERLYYAVATFPDASRANADVRLLPPEVAPFLVISRSFTGRPLRSVVGAGVRGGGGGGGYGGGAAPALDWAGDAAKPGAQPVAPAAPAPSASAPAGAAPGGAPAQNGGAPAAGAPHAAGLGYDDGFDPHLWARPLEDEAADEADGYGVDGPVPDGDGAPSLASAASYAGALAVTPEYPQASRFEAAHSGNYSTVSGTRTINRVVIHITDGGRAIGGTISWFKDPAAKVSAHYVVGQDGEVVQMVRHNDKAWHARSANRDSIGIEHVASKSRGILPTDAEYAASAALTRWLCEQYSIPMDRQHILGHSEADAGTTHSGCPNSVWNWDHYMNLVTNAISAPQPAVSQGQSYGGGYGNGNGNGGGGYGQSRVQVGSLVGGNGRHAAAQGLSAPYAGGLSVVQNAYNPANAQDALAAQLEFQRRFNQWSAGVRDTSFFPHSAICQLEIWYPGASGPGLGTGFYIGEDRILTAAHCVVDWANGRAQPSSIRVIPGKKGAGSSEATEPFGSFTAQPADWSFHSRYDGTRSFDLAVIRASSPPPNGHFFDILEELNESKQSAIVVTGYAAVTQNGNVQHMDGDQVRTLGADGETLQYNLQTEGGTSGSPVYYVWAREDEQRQQSMLETRIVGVHVSGFSSTLNQACRLTEAKIAWIRAQFTPAASASYGLAYAGGPRFPSRMLGGPVDINWDDVPLIGQVSPNTCWAASAAMLMSWLEGGPPQNPRDVSSRGGFLERYDSDRGLAATDRVALAGGLGLEQEPGMSFTIDGFANLLTTKGPFWIAERTASGSNHIVVVTGIQSDGADDGSGTVVRILDPMGREPGTAAAPGRAIQAGGLGSRYMVNWPVFVRMYEGRVSGAPDGGADGQILHATGTGGRSPTSGSGYSFAYGLGATALDDIPLDPGPGGRSIGESALAAGDIIVSTTSAFISDAIRAVSAAAVSHAGIYTGSGTVIEAIGAGVVERPIAESLAADTLAVAFRVPGLTAGQAQAAVEYALAQVGRGYNYFGIVRQAAYRYHSSYCRLLPESLRDRCRTAVARVDLGTGSNDTFFCSQLVLAAYRAAGVPLTTTDPTWTSPGELADLRLGTTLEYVGHLKAPPLATGSALAYGGGARLSRPLSVTGFPQQDFDTLKATFVANAAGGSQQNCITIVNAALRAMYGARLREADGSAKPLGSRIDRTMAALQGYGLASAETVFQFLDASGTLTKGVVRPDRLQSSVEGWIGAQAAAAQMSGWYLFGLSILDGYHSVVLGLQYGGLGDPSNKVFWADQIYSGWDDVTGGLDARLTQLTQKWWDKANAATPGRVPRTRATLWPLVP